MFTMLNTAHDWVSRTYSSTMICNLCMCACVWMYSAFFILQRSASVWRKGLKREEGTEKKKRRKNRNYYGF